MPVFTQVYGPVTKEGADWTRWDYKTADGDRKAHFASTQEIPLNTEVALELTAKGAIKNWKATGASVSAGNPQMVEMLQNVQQGGSGAYNAPQRDFDAEARGKTRCQLVSRLLPAMFTALGPEAQNKESAEVLLGWAMGYVFTDDEIPF